MAAALKPIAIFLCDLSGNMAVPWADAGIECYCVDTAHSIRQPIKHKNINYVWGDARTWRPPERRRIVFVAGFPPCTHTAASGARDFATKGGQALRDALEIFEAVRQCAAWSGAPYCIEQPVGVLATIPHIGIPNHYFHPFHFTGWHKADNYTKKTCLWTGNGFVMPPIKRARGMKKPDDRIHKTGPRAGEQANVRSKTPMGFALAVYHANKPSRRQLSRLDQDPDQVRPGRTQATPRSNPDQTRSDPEETRRQLRRERRAARRRAKRLAWLSA